VATLLTWIVIAYAFRYSSLAALISALFAPFYYTLLFGLNSIGLAVLIMSGVLIWRHRSNVGNLIAGKESKIGKKQA
jgi:glycerol-3-phosphate acyltransferase PlsY